MQIRNAIPNLLTLGNLACGLLAIVMLLDRSAFSDIPYAAIGWLMAGAMAFDFADGFVARALKATSPVGKELDSLSDLVSFGVLPGLMVYTILHQQMLYQHSLENGAFAPWSEHALPLWRSLLAYTGLLIPLFSAYRLAKFNVDTRQSYGFLGLPTPANALFFLAIFLVYGIDAQGSGAFNFDAAILGNGGLGKASFVVTTTLPVFKWLFQPYVLAGLSLLFSILLITELPLLAMKFKDYSWKGNWPRYALLLISVPLLAILWFRAIPLIIILYFVFSFIDHRLHKKA
jgi:CDP-diacylglycerol---serine O-phosphatidyltransferase